MTITLLSQAPDILNLKTRHVQKETALIISPPFVGHEDPIQGDVLICEE
jgi:nucleotide-sensitive chloride channel 1A